MGTEIFTQSNIMFFLGLVGIGYTVFRAFYDPQKKSEQNDMLMDQKANFLREEYGKRFEVMQGNFETLATQNQNHLHAIDTKIDGLTSTINQSCRDIIKLETIINERIPKKQ